jgi:chromosome partitioning protein
VTPHVAIYSEKGGVGKTALATGLAAVAGTRGQRVLVVDLDPRATATDELGVTKVAYSVNDLLYQDPGEADPVDVRGLATEAVVPAGKDWPDGVLVLAAERALAHREADPTTGMELRLRRSLEGVPEALGVDLVLLDVPPRAGGKLAGAALIDATHVLIPATLDEDGRVGAREARTSVRRVAASARPELELAGVVRNIVEGRRTNLAGAIEQWLREEYPDLLLPVTIPRHVVRQETRFARVPITAASAAGPEARALCAAYGAVLDHLLTLGG